MLDREKLEAALSELPLYVYAFLETKDLEFSPRIRHICRTECPMYGKSWACPPGVGSVEDCQAKCGKYPQYLLIGTIVEVEDITDLEGGLATRGPHEALTNRVRDLMREQGVEPYILSTEACAVCARCAILDGLPCRLPGKMHPCVESHGIVLTSVLDELGLEFQYGSNIITWYSMLFFR